MTTTRTPEEIENIKKQIEKMSQYEMAYMKRFAPSGHIYFDMTLPFSDFFEKRFRELGGMTPKISKELGWGR